MLPLAYLALSFQATINDVKSLWMLLLLAFIAWSENSKSWEFLFKA